MNETQHDPVWQREHVLNLIQRRESAGELPVRWADLMNDAGLPQEAVRTALTVLIEEGKLTEETPGFFDVPGEPEAVQEPGLPPEPEEEEEEEEQPEPERARGHVVGAHREVVLTQGMVNTLSNEALGEVVKAGVQEASEGRETFVLVVR